MRSDLKENRLEIEKPISKNSDFQRIFTQKTKWNCSWTNCNWFNWNVIDYYVVIMIMIKSMVETNFPKFSSSIDIGKRKKH